VPGDGGPQLGDARPGRVLVAPGPDRIDSGGQQLRRAVGVRKALAQVDAAGLHRDRGHLGKDRRPEAL
jgi:hypothetical protein